jgi:hypothetical protein
MGRRWLVRAWLWSAFALAVAAAAAPFATIALGFALSALWAVVVVAGFFMLGRARWWLLLGLPTALFHPAAFILLGAACTLDTGQCP